MVSLTRRRLLHVATVTIGGLAGCSQFTGGEASSTRSVSNDGVTIPESDTATDPPMVRRRAAVPPIRLTDLDSEPTETPQWESAPRLNQYEVIDSQSRARRLTVADGVGGDELSSFISATNFDSETLYLETQQVKECFRLQLCYVSWQSKKIQTDYTRTLRPYDESCTADGHVFESRLVRLPVALDAKSINSYGSSIGGSGRCNRSGSARSEGASGSSDSTTTPTTTAEGEQ
ncbi:hypothetical protein M0R89_23130 (plasmid) [Halorussus limi]|uniref:Uncharacterized protein n=1 Tax=Halorussus limi TaxID=2938695 RepID=A0A8U0I1L0_9EURY|nr:hypothetical protein [Halorussus limi]UPV77140.1 hypothetical protein M0R89_23130 [Halorussus limi]